MTTIAGFPYAKAHFDRHGKATDQPALPSGLTDVVIFSHGWNNNEEEAQSLYTRFFESFNALPPEPRLSDRRFGVIGIFWPAKKFDETVAVAGDGAVGGAASLTARASSTAALERKLDALQGFFVEPAQKKALQQLKALLPELEDKASARALFLKTIREQVLDPRAANKEDGSVAFFRDPADDIMSRLKIAAAALEPEVAAPSGATALPVGAPRHSTDTAGAAGLKEVLSGFGAAAMNVLNFTTYYEMKARAGEVGTAGVAPLIDSLRGEVARIHLIGHSFGGRVVTAAALSSRSAKIASLTLLQAAFSHNGFSAEMKGAFRGVVEKDRVAGPIIVTHTKNDKAVGLAYPLASRLSGDMRAAFGDENDKFGGLGRNGVQKMDANERVAGKLGDVGTAYPFQPHVFFNLEGGPFIKGHGDVTGPQVAYAVQRAFASI